MTLGIQTLTQMIDEVGRKVRNTSTGARQRHKDNINSSYDELVAEYDWPQLQRSDSVGLRQAGNTTYETFMSGEADVPLPWNAENVISITTYSPSVVHLERTTLADIAHRAGSQINTAGVPLYFADAGRTAQFRSLPAASVLTVLSSSSGNNGVRDVRITYRTSTAHLGRGVFEDVLGGAFSTGVASAATAAAGFSIESIQLPKDWVGTCTVRDASANTVVEIPGLEAGATAAEHWQILSRPLVRVWPPPNSNYKATVVWEHKPRALLENQDAPEIPVSTALVYMAAAKYLLDDGRLEEAAYYDQKAAMALRKIHGAGPRISSGLKPRGGNILLGTGIRTRFVRRGNII